MANVVLIHKDIWKAFCDKAVERGYGKEDICHTRISHNYYRLDCGSITSSVAHGIGMTVANKMRVVTETYFD